MPQRTTQTTSAGALKPATVLATGLALLAGSIPLQAHHSFAAEFDAAKRVKIEGVVTRVEWANPHTHFYVDVKTENGRLESWELELGSPNMLQREGWNRNSLKQGDHVLVDGFVARDGSKLANVRDIRLPDGRRILVGLAGHNTPPLEFTPVP